MVKLKQLLQVLPLNASSFATCLGCIALGMEGVGHKCMKILDTVVNISFSYF